MRSRSIQLVLPAMLVLAAVPASAQGFISPYAGYNFGGESANCVSLQNCEDKRLNIGVSLGTVRGAAGFEEDIAYARDFFGYTPGVSNAVLTAMSNLMIAIPAGPLQPYFVVGLGLIRSHAQLDTSILSLTQNSLGYDFGGGLNIFLGHSFGIRGDIRKLSTFEDITLGLFSDAKVDFWRASAGVTLRF
jgi:hypothetical protein